MRKLVIATAALSLAVVDAAAQPAPQGSPRPMAGQGQIQRGPAVGQPQAGRWGSKVGGRWHGGTTAPGGWNAYRRPVRGYVLPRYWVAPSWSVNDWASYDLPQPPAGYSWSRYYDDAVLIDSRGSVYDTVEGVNWDGGMAGGGVGADYADRYARDGQRGYDDRGYDGGGARDNGVGGAVVGGVAGGVAGNLIAGRGNRLAGTAIGAGVGAAAGYAIDRAEDRRREPPRPGAGYARPGYDGGRMAPPPHHDGGGYTQPHVVHHGGGTVVTTSGGHAGTYYVPAGSVTTITIASAPVVTTTVTETYEDVVTYSKPTHRKVYRQRAGKARRYTKCKC